ncbi:MAG TPA: nucleotide exchange factor GrpE [Candidatus Krumholzibacteria bacterium]|nr:nucleotide exchange factor GrpE [Candidatus Krumholzibacteria bacterium]HRX50209.1 nucleotide exchange factor GrpE [Candidatus Krumholzibacteria bacterium]
MPDSRTPEHEPETELQPDAAAADAAENDADPAADPLADLERERDEARDRLLRAAAEMDNLRKRTRREVQDAHAFATADVVRDMLEVLDDVERALAAAGEEGEADGPAAAIRQGVAMIEARLRDALTRRGVERLTVGAGDEFDPREHEAVAQIPGGDVPSGAVVDVVLAGYRLGDRVLRPARVVVAQ